MLLSIVLFKYCVFHHSILATYMYPGIFVSSRYSNLLYVIFVIISSKPIYFCRADYSVSFFISDIYLKLFSFFLSKSKCLLIRLSILLTLCFVSTSIISALYFMIYFLLSGRRIKKISLAVRGWGLKKTKQLQMHTWIQLSTLYCKGLLLPHSLYR